jgi:beta-lactamase regulating signal transducer with metallopeptidase domain
MNTAFAVEWGIRGAVPAAIVAAVIVLLRMRDHRMERTLWRSALVFAYAVPLLTLANAGRVNASSIALPTMPAVTLPSLVEIVAPATGAPASWTMRLGHAAMMLWAGVSTVLLVRLVIGVLGSLRLLRSSTPAPAAMTHEAGVRVCRSITSPVTVGSTVLLPADMSPWSPAEHKAIIAHELHHVRSADFWWQLVARAYAAIYWWNPATWIITARLRRLAEYMSDSAALTVMPDRRTYASLLVSVAAVAQRAGGTYVPAFHVAMARRGMLCERIDLVIRGVQSTPLHGARRRLALGMPCLGAVMVALTPNTGTQAILNGAVTPVPPAHSATVPTIRTDSVVIKLFATRTIDAAAERAIARAADPVAARDVYTGARGDARIRWIARRADDTELASGVTPAELKLPDTMPFAITYCSADPVTWLRVEYRFSGGVHGWATGACSKIFRDGRGSGSEGVPYSGRR